MKMNDLKMEVFNNSEFGSVRIIQEGEKHLFCAKDVAIALGYKDTINAIKAHCKGVVKRHLLSEGGSQLTNGWAAALSPATGICCVPPLTALLQKSRTTLKRF